jgi:hypothetical protein
MVAPGSEEGDVASIIPLFVFRHREARGCFNGEGDVGLKLLAAMGEMPNMAIVVP